MCTITSEEQSCCNRLKMPVSQTDSWLGTMGQTSPPKQPCLRLDYIYLSSPTLDVDLLLLSQVSAGWLCELALGLLSWERANVAEIILSFGSCGWEHESAMQVS